MMGMPLQFEANHGQVDAQVKFLSRGSGYTLFLTPTESVMVLRQREAPSQPGDIHDPQATTEPAPIKQSVVRMKLEGANPSPAIDGLEQLPGIVNYFIGNDPEKWRTKIPTYAKVQYKEAYPGIDLAYYGNQGKLEYDLIVAPGADPNQIKLAFEGASDIRVADSGDLLLTTALGEMRLQKPIVYQVENNGHKTLVAGKYILETQSASLHVSHTMSYSVGFQLASYDHAKPVVIDPVLLLYSTYLGGSASDNGGAIAVDTAGQAYVTGTAFSTNFPTATPFQAASGGRFDAVVMKLSASGTSLLYSTYLGGSNVDQGHGIAVDAAGQAYVMGTTNSTNFPTATPFQATLGSLGMEDVFVTKLNAAGTSLLYSTYLGGSGVDDGRGIAVDAAGQAYVTGATASTNFPTVTPFQSTLGGTQDAFVTKLNAAGTSLLYSTYLGGSNTENNLADGAGIAVDIAGQAYVTGTTLSTDFPTANPFQATLGGTQDAFVTKLSAAGTSLLYSTYLGGNSTERGHGIAVDAAGQAYVTGETSSTNFPTVTPFQATLGTVPDAFVTKLSAAGTSLLYSIYLGGNNLDQGWGIAVDAAGYAYVTGTTASTNFPTANPFQATPVHAREVFVTKLSAAGTSLLYSTYLGGNDGTASVEAGFGIAVDAVGYAYVTGMTNSTNFPTSNPVQAMSGGAGDAFVTKLSDKPLANAGIDQSVPEGTLVTLDGSGSTGGSLTYIWTQVAGPTAALGGATSAHPTFSAPHVPAAGGTVTFELVVCEGTSSNCSDPDSVNVHIMNINQPPVADAGLDQTLQEGSPVVLNGTASYDPDVEALTYTWLQLYGPPVTLANAATATPSFLAPPVGSGGAQVDFELIVTDPHGLHHADYVSVVVTNVNQIPVAHAGPDQTVNENALVTLNGTGSTDPDLDPLHFTWTQTAGPHVPLTGGATASPTFTAPVVAVGGATLTFQLVASDGQASSAADSVTIHVADTNDPPVCTLAQPSVTSLWPPNHMMVPVTIMGVTDPNNQAVTFTFTSVTQDEPVNGLGDGDTSPDAAASGNQILLRAERAGTGNGRVYVVHFTATDAEGAHCSGTVKVGVPHSKKDTAGDNGQLFNSFAP
jgi:hypothetical protein